MLSCCLWRLDKPLFELYSLAVPWSLDANSFLPGLNSASVAAYFAMGPCIVLVTIPFCVLILIFALHVCLSCLGYCIQLNLGGALEGSV